MKRWLALAPLAALASCKLGGPSADPNAYVASDSGEDATVEGGHGDDAPLPSDDSGPVPPGDDSGAPSAPDGSAGASCVDAAVAVCDPVHNTGCNPLIMQQCDVGTSLTMMPTGNCVFYNGTDAGGACTSSPVNETCPPGNTCVSSVCRALCFCDTDCPAGQCCSDTSGPQGFTLCTKCM